jgi:hypothetical protein
MPEFKKKAPTPIDAPPKGVSPSSSAKLLENTLLETARRSASRTPSSDSLVWGARRQKISVSELEAARRADETAASSACLEAVAAFSDPAECTPMSPAEVDELLAAALAEVNGEAVAEEMTESAEAKQSVGPAETTVQHEEAEQTGHAPAEVARQSTPPQDEAPQLLLPSPTRAPGLAGELARARALLLDAHEEQMRLEVELAAERVAAEEEAARAAATLELERLRYRREVEFVRAGVDTASAQRSAAAAKQAEAHERAVRRAERQAEARTSAAAAEAALVAEEAHTAALSQQQERYENQLTLLTEQLVALAGQARRLQRTGALPGGTCTRATGAVTNGDSGGLWLDEVEDESEGVDGANAACRILAEVLAAVNVDAAQGGAVVSRSVNAATAAQTADEVPAEADATSHETISGRTGGDGIS